VGLGDGQAAGVLLTYDLQLSVRPARGSDLAFINSTWKMKVRQLAPYFSERKCQRCGASMRGVNKNWFFAAQRALIRELLVRSTVLVAHSVNNDDQLYGFIVAEPAEEPPLVHWLLTKDGSVRGAGVGYRRAGVAQRLMEAAFPQLGEVDIVGTFRTPACSKLPARWRLSFDTHKLVEVLK